MFMRIPCILIVTAILSAGCDTSGILPKFDALIISPKNGESSPSVSAAGSDIGVELVPNVRESDVGDILDISVAVKIGGTRPVEVFSNGVALYTLDIEATRDGLPLPLNKQGNEMLMEGADQSWLGTEWTPGNILRYSLCMNDLYDLNTPGKYVFSVSPQLGYRESGRVQKITIHQSVTVSIKGR